MLDCGFDGVIEIRFIPRMTHSYRNNWAMNRGPLSVNIKCGIPYEKTKLFQRQAATRGAVVSFIRTARASLEYRSLITTMKRLKGLVLGSGSRVSIHTNSNGPTAGKRRRCFCNFSSVPRSFACDW